MKLTLRLTEGEDIVSIIRDVRTREEALAVLNSAWNEQDKRKESVYDILPSDVEPNEGVGHGIYDVDEQGIPKWL